MSNSDTIFVVGEEPLDALADWMADALQLERRDDPGLKEDEHFFAGRARTVDGRVLLFVGPNVYGESDPEPEDVSAIDRYTGAVNVRISGSRNEAVQAKEARAVFDELAATQPRVALVLATAMSWIVAAYLPGAGVHTFPPRTSLDVDDIDAWRPWVVA
ncbi:hypothetical protein EV651_115101 [Kribbella sp. VKM Ac-2571]|uniref:hypothetical protein n=1 Tax=Kribbella sp. VKM Ac-2571 TaxID=2512222 RepID=UPI00105D8831|nr:hypothetical protein [Kribbella sp. VKM Ac-2571]TDO55137.1 hypothetical protein EV651_115101 [Kribbella sp. VKM Ac-2571]